MSFSTSYMSISTVEPIWLSSRETSILNPGSPKYSGKVHVQDFPFCKNSIVGNFNLIMNFHVFFQIEVVCNIANKIIRDGKSAEKNNGKKEKNYKTSITSSLSSVIWRISIKSSAISLKSISTD